MNRLILDLLDVASIDAGKFGCAIAPRDPAALILETLDLFRDAAEKKGIALTADIKDAIPSGAFDYQRMLQVFSNIVSNALKFTARGGQVCIRGERSGGEVRFSVSDTGIGIPHTLFEAVFQRFWQGGPNEPRGTGLGLYISKHLIQAHGGRIWVESKVGMGSVFHFTVPVADGGAPPPPSAYGFARSPCGSTWRHGRRRLRFRNRRWPSSCVPPSERPEKRG